MCDWALGKCLKQPRIVRESFPSPLKNAYVPCLEYLRTKRTTFYKEKIVISSGYLNWERRFLHSPLRNRQHIQKKKQKETEITYHKSLG